MSLFIVRRPFRTLGQKDIKRNYNRDHIVKITILHSVKKAPRIKLDNDSADRSDSSDSDSTNEYRHKAGGTANCLGF